MEQRIEQLIEICVQSGGDLKIYETLFECLVQNNGPYYIKYLQLLNDLIKSSNLNSKIFNYILKYFQFDKLVVDIELDSLILIQWLQNISIKNWKLLIIVCNLSRDYPQLVSKQFLELLNHFPFNLNHFPSYLMLKIIQKNYFTDHSFDFSSLMVYKIDQIIINNKERYMGPIYVQVIHNSLYLYIDSIGILLEIDNFQYYHNDTEKHNKEIILKINNFWFLFDKNDYVHNDTTSATTISSSITNNHILSSHENLTTITLLSPFAENNKYRVSTSKTILKLNGNLTPSQDSILITKCNEISPPNNTKKSVKKYYIDNKIENTEKKANNKVNNYKESKIVKSRVEKLPNNLKYNKKNKDKKSLSVSCKNSKPLKQGHLDNYKPVITIESSQLDVQKDLIQLQSDKTTIKEEKTGTLQKTNVISDDSTTILANVTTTTVTTDSIPTNLSKKSKLNNVENTNNEDIIRIDNPAISKNKATISSTVTPPNGFTNLLQQQIEQSVNMFTRDLVIKVNMINREAKQALIKPLLSKYTKKIEDLQEEFQRDTDSLVTNFENMVTKLHWNQNDLFQFLENSRRTT